MRPEPLLTRRTRVHPREVEWRESYWQRPFLPGGRRITTVETARRVRLLASATIVYVALSLIFSLVHLVSGHQNDIRAILGFVGAVGAALVPAFVQGMLSERAGGIWLVCVLWVVGTATAAVGFGLWDEAFLVILVLPWLTATLVAPAAGLVLSGLLGAEIFVFMFMGLTPDGFHDVFAGRAYAVTWPLVLFCVSTFVGIGGFLLERVTLARLHAGEAALGRAHRRFERSRTLFHSLVQHTSDLLTLLDEKGVIVYQSPSCRAILGYDPDRLLGESAFSYVVEEDRDRLQRLFERLMRGARSDERPMRSPRFRLMRADGSLIWAEATAVDLRSDPVVHSVVLHTADVTVKRAAEEELIRARDEAERLARTRTAFLANMSHDIRSPLTSIVGFAAILSEEVEGAHREFATLIGSAGRRLLVTLNEVLDLAQMEAGELHTHWVMVKVEPEVRESVALFTPLAEEKGLALEVSVPEDLTVMMDVAFFHRILNNLLSNAVKYTHRGRIGVDVYLAEGALNLVVEDTGVGMTAAFQEQLFQKYRRERVGAGHSGDGIGLGLAITHQLVDLMDGAIAVASEPGEGSRFHIRIPQPPLTEPMT